MPVDNHVKRMLEELKVALAQAIRSSSGVTETVRKIREQGFNLHLVLSFDHGREASGRAAVCDPGPELEALGEGAESYQGPAELGRAAGRRKLRQRFELDPRATPPWVLASRVGASGPRVQETAESPPTFRLSGYDVSLLQSLGIDPTRKVRQARRRPPGRRRGGKKDL